MRSACKIHNKNPLWSIFAQLHEINIGYKTYPHKSLRDIVSIFIYSLRIKGVHFYATCILITDFITDFSTSLNIVKQKEKKVSDVWMWNSLMYEGPGHHRRERDLEIIWE